MVSCSQVVLHTDTHLLPARKSAWASLNYRLGGSGHTHAAVTYNLNRLQGIHSESTFCVNVNQSAGIDPATVLGRFKYAHPQFSLKAVAAQERREELNGEHHSF